MLARLDVRHPRSETSLEVALPGAPPEDHRSKDPFSGRVENVKDSGRIKIFQFFMLAIERLVGVRRNAIQNAASSDSFVWATLTAFPRSTRELARYSYYLISCVLIR